MARLRITSGPLAGKTVDVEGELVIGREDTDLTIEDVEMSRHHAVVRPFESRLQVEDLGSRNGTFVDGNRIEGPTLLGGGAEIKLGTTVLVVEGVLPVSGAGDASDRGATRVSSAPSEAAAAPAAGPPVSPPAPGPLPQTPEAPPLAPFHPPAQPQTRGLASRSWVPVALSFGTVIIVAIALIIYFATR